MADANDSDLVLIGWTNGLHVTRRATDEETEEYARSRRSDATPFELCQERVQRSIADAQRVRDMM